MTQLGKVQGRGTAVVNDENGIEVIYHGTRVVTVKPDGTIILNTGGWRTNTTKTRMNQAANEFGLAYRVWQEDFRWFVEYKGETIPFDDTTITLKP